MDFKFGITWLFDKLGYIPKINVKVGEVDLKVEDTWPFPVPKTNPTPKKKPAAKKVIVSKKPKVAAKTARTKAK